MAYDPASGFRRPLPSERELIREEVADVVGLTPSERAELLALACRSGAQLLALRSEDERRRILESRDPVTAETERALARLRARYRRRISGG
jgi:hypothetical protein